MISLILLGIMAVVFIIQSANYEAITFAFSFFPALAFAEPWRFITALFLHADFTHIFFNGYALLMFGPILERKIGSKNFLILFLIAGLSGNLLYYAFGELGVGATIPGTDLIVPAIGASGAIYGVMGALAVMLPNLRILFFFFPMRLREAAIFWIVIEFLGTFNTGSGIASAGHLGGLLLGLAFAWYLKKKEKEVPDFYATY